MSILQIYQHFWLYKGSWLRNWILFSFYNSTNIFGSTRGLGLEIEFYFHSTNLPTFLALQGVPGFKVEFYFILQIYQLFWLYKGFLVFKGEFYFHSTNLPTFLATQVVWASKLEYMTILQIYSHFWLYKSPVVQVGIICPFYKSTNIFGSTRGSGLQSWNYAIRNFWKKNVFGIIN